MSAAQRKRADVAEQRQHARLLPEPSGLAWQALAVLLVVLCVGALCAPLVMTPFVADDIVVLSRSLPTLQDTTGLHLLRVRVDANTNAMHWLPVAGLVEGAAIWFSVSLARLTPFDVSQAWGLLRVAWVLVTAAAATVFLRSWRSRAAGEAKACPPVVTFGGIALIMAVSLQVHAAWSNDPVISYNAYGWPSVVLSLLYLAFIGRLLTRTATRGRDVLLAVATGSAAVLAYELSLGAVLGAGAAVLLAVVRGWRPSPRGYLPALATAATVLVPLGVLVAGLLLRDPGPGTYAGTQLRLGLLALQTWLVGMAGALPGAGWWRSHEAFGAPQVGLRMPALVVLALSGLLAVVLRKAPTPRPERVGSRSERVGAARASGLQWQLPLVALVIYWSVATAIHAVTPKYQDEIRLTIGNVYIFYAVGFACVALLIHMAAERLAPRVPQRVMPFLAMPLAVLVLYQVAVNHQQAALLRGSATWSEDVLNAVAEQTPQRERCEALQRLAAAPLHPHLEGFRVSVGEATTGYESTYGEPFCAQPGFGGVVSGAYAPETGPGGETFWWVSAATAAVRVQRLPGAPGRVEFSLPVSNVPCGTTRTVTGRAGDQQRTVQLDSARPTELLSFVIPAGVAEVNVDLSIAGAACTVSGDPRTFLLYVGAPAYPPAA